MTQYLNVPGRLVFSPPYALNDTYMYSWVIQGQQAKLQATIDTCLNAPLQGSDTRFEVTSDYLLFVISYINQGGPTPPSTDAGKSGTMQETETGFWIPVLKTKNGKPVEFLWYVAFIYVNNPFAMALGREVFGYNKNFAIFDPANQQDTFARLKVHTWAFPEFGPNGRGALHPLYEVQKINPSLTQEMEEILEDVEAAADIWKEFKADSTKSLILSFLWNLFQKKVPMVFLKQFPSASEPGQACYQEVLEAACQVTKLTSFHFQYSRFQLLAHNYASAPFVEALGLKEGPQDLDLGIVVQMDFNQTLGNRP